MQEVIDEPYLVYLPSSYSFTPDQPVKVTVDKRSCILIAQLYEELKLPLWTSRISSGSFVTCDISISSISQFNENYSKLRISLCILSDCWFPTTLGLQKCRPSSLDVSNDITSLTNDLDSLILQKGCFSFVSFKGAIFYVTSILADNCIEIENAVKISTEKEIELVIQSPLELNKQKINEDDCMYLSQLKELEFYASKNFTLENFSLVGNCLELKGNEWIGNSVNSALICGPIGIGKSFLINALFSKLDLPVFRLNFYEFIHSMHKRDNFLVNIIDKARLTCPCILYIENLELLSLDLNANDVDPFKIAKEFLSEMSRITSDSLVFVIGSIHELTAVPPALVDKSTATFSFQRIVSLDIPNREQRQLLLKSLLRDKTLNQPTTDKVWSSNELVELYAKELSLVSIGFTASQLIQLVEQSKIVSDASIEDSLFHLNLSNESKRTAVESFDLLHLKATAERLKPKSQLFDTEKSKIPWSRVGGYTEIKERCMQIADAYLQEDNSFQRLGLALPKGILFYGPSGCGKTFLARALASNSRMNFITAKCQKLFGKYLGESEASIRRLFQLARKMSPCIVFLDEIDVIGSKREWNSSSTGVNERMLSTLLNEMDGIEDSGDILMIACTSRPWAVDDALLRPGRLDIHFYIGLPNEQDRLSILESMKVPTNVTMKDMVPRTHGLTCGDLVKLLRDAAYFAHDRSSDLIEIVDVESSLAQFSSNSIENLDRFEQFRHRKR